MLALSMKITMGKLQPRMIPQLNVYFRIKRAEKLIGGSPHFPKIFTVRLLFDGPFFNYRRNRADNSVDRQAD